MVDFIHNAKSTYEKIFGFISFNFINIHCMRLKSKQTDRQTNKKQNKNKPLKNTFHIHVHVIHVIKVWG